MTDLTSLTLAQARDALREKKLSATELADAHLAAMAKAKALNAFVLETPERARDMAGACDARLAKGEGGPLEGLPLGIKDLFCTEGVRTTACSHILDDFVPTYESTVTANLWRDGAVLLGKLNNDEFAMGSSNETSHFGPVVSPWRRRGSDRHRYRRLDPPAGGVLRHRRIETDLRPLLALGHRRLRILARSSRSFCPHGARLRDPVALDGGSRSEGHDLHRSAGARL
jgi:Asp-tRNA(Asn)/Glu-tRNA(Gln) amidotransferase A subunit family amidase